MSNPHPTEPPPSVHATTYLDPTQLRVKPITGHPGRVAIFFDRYGDASIFCTADQWDLIDAAVRVGMAALAVTA